MAATRYISDMDEVTLPLPSDLWAMVPVLAQAPLLEQFGALRTRNAALEAQVSGLRAEVRDLRARLGPDSSHSSRSPSSDPPRAPAQRRASPSGRKRGGQPGHHGSFRLLLRVEQVDEVVVVAPEHCRHCQQPFPSTEARRRGRAWRHPVVELLTLAVRVTEDQIAVRLRPCGPRLTAVVALLAGRYRLSRREVRQVLVD